MIQNVVNAVCGQNIWSRPDCCLDSQSLMVQYIWTLQCPHITLIMLFFCKARKTFIYANATNIQNILCLNRTWKPRTFVIDSGKVMTMSSFSLIFTFLRLHLWPKFSHSFSQNVIISSSLPRRCVLFLVFILRCNIV